MSDEGLRARALIYATNKFSNQFVTAGQFVDAIADFAAQIREEDCKAVCDECAYSESMKVKAAELSPSEKTWVHYFLDGNGHYICDAAAIHNLSERSKE